MSGADEGRESIGLLRLRRTIAEQYVVVLVLLLVLGSVGLWAGYAAHVDPGTRTETRTVSEWRRTASFEHGATVTAENPLYETGQRIESRGAYSPFVTPVVSGEYRFSYAASESGSVDVTVGQQLVVENRADGTVFWRQSRRLGETTATDVGPGETTYAEFRFDLNRTRLRLQRIEETFGDTPGDPAVIVRTRTRVSGEINDHAVDRTFVDELRLRPDGDTFVVRDPGQITNASSRTKPVEVQREYSPIRGVGGPLAAVVGVGGAVGIVVARRSGALEPSAAERDRLARATYAEWLSRGSLPDRIDVDGDDVVELSTLVDLVDVAADTNGRVLYDPDREYYAVLGDEYTYLCQPLFREEERRTTEEQ